MSGRADINRRPAFLPEDGKVRQIRSGKPVRDTNDKCHGLAAEPRGFLGQRRLVREGRDDPERVRSGNVGGGDHGINIRPRCGPLDKIAEAEVGKIVWAANGADQARPVWPAVGTKSLGRVHLGASVKALDGGADRLARVGRQAAGSRLADIHHGIDDLGIAGASAQHAAKRILDSLPVRCRVTAEKRGCRHHHAGSANPALRRAVPQERFLECR